MGTVRSLDTQKAELRCERQKRARAEHEQIFTPAPALQIWLGLVDFGRGWFLVGFGWFWLVFGWFWLVSGWFWLVFGWFLVGFGWFWLDFGRILVAVLVAVWPAAP